MYKDLIRGLLSRLGIMTRNLLKMRLSRIFSKLINKL